MCWTELTCLFHSAEHLCVAREQKSSEVEYQLVVSDLDRLAYASQYFTIKISCWALTIRAHHTDKAAQQAINSS